MEKDPLLIKDEEVDRIVNYLTEAYKNWQVEEAKASMDEKKPKPSKGVSAAKAKGIDLSDLGL